MVILWKKRYTVRSHSVGDWDFIRLRPHLRLAQDSTVSLIEGAGR
jgi:hypothetical protein